MRISFLLHNAYAVGGTVRSTLNLAGALASRHEVEVVSVFRTANKPLLEVSGKVRLRPLVDERPDAASYEGTHELMAQPSDIVPPSEVLAHRYTALTDHRLCTFLDATDADVVVATRPALVVLLAEHGSRRYLRIGQEHLSYGHHVPGVRAAQNQAIRHLDAFVTVSARDAADHQRHLPTARARITGIGNTAPRPKAEPSDLSVPLVVAAGRLVRVKRYDLLIEAFAKVAAVHPEWRLRIYGQGPERARLRAVVDALGLNDHVFLMGSHAAIETEWAKASVAAVSSEWESFGMTILEAMHAGVPVVAADCPHGPGEIVTAGRDGLLVPPGNADALAGGLLTLIEDRDLRIRLGTAGRAAVQRYAPRVIAGEYEQLFAELRRARTSVAVKAARRVRRAVRGAVGETVRGAVRDVVRDLLPRAPVASAAPNAPNAPVAHQSAPPPLPAPPEAGPRPLRPKGGCRVDAEGDVRVSVRASGLPDLTGPGERFVLVLRHRRGGAGAPEARVPLEPPTGAKGAWSATLAHGRLDLAEGRWDVYVERLPDGARRRLAALLVEQRGLLRTAPALAPEESVAWWIPYRTKGGHLALRTFRRTAHGEVTALSAVDGSPAVEGVLHGPAPLGGGAALVGVGRGQDTEGFEAPVTTAEGRCFRVRLTALPGPAGSAEETVWDLYLRPAEGAAPVRLGRLLDDVVDRRKTAKYPAVVLPGTDGATVRARFLFTVTNDLGVSVRRDGVT
ncbi:glycosyl transferase family 1 [Streptomyces ruber]|uniref:D-inositol 3-phosphate glycosyltransferase n=2 Tax=Streptomyces TaxID=1883 RepID=A0A918BAI8_9ACTN|nr:glycosyltransferase family 4 protein [Streptomyces ruber]GGQ39724.1 glycosyl transferase family 1 [Streptomyces ruber]